MEFKDFELFFQRAVSHIFAPIKLIISSIALALCGTLIVVALGLSFAANDWINLSLAFLPVFISALALTVVGVFLIRLYHDEIKDRPLYYMKVGSDMGQVLTNASYFFVPIMLIYLLLWIVIGLFFLIKTMPIIGDFFGIILAFGPFLLIVGCLLLSIASLLISFLIAPIIALKTLSREHLLQYVQESARHQLLLRLLCWCIAIFPTCVMTAFLWFAAKITTVVYVDPYNTWQMVLQWFFIMIPFAVLLSPAVVFFFNMAAEAHVLIQKGRLPPT